MSLTEFLSMGGYGKYVWTSYIVTLVILAMNIILPKVREDKTLRDLQKRFFSEEKK